MENPTFRFEGVNDECLGPILTLKLPIRSATMPATGGMTIATIGNTADMMAVSSTLIPISFMWMVRYGYSTYKAAATR